MTLLYFYQSYQGQTNVVFDWELELERVRQSQLCYCDTYVPIVYK